MSSAADTDELFRLLDPAVRATGLDLEAIDVTPAGRRRLLRVVVDKDGGVSLDDVAAASTAVSARLDRPDAEEAVGGAPYVLEVTSPGVDRPLTLPRHWRRATGRLVEARLADGEAVVGRVRSAGDASVLLAVDGHEREVAYPDVASARMQVEFARPDPEAGGDGVADGPGEGGD